MGTEPDVRVSDAEREAVASVLRDAAATGRLDADELEERVALAYGARTRGDLEGLTTDLPAAPPVVAEPSRVPAVRGTPAGEKLAGFLIPNVVCNIVWIATGGPWWPVWVLMGTGIGFAVWVINAGLGVDHDHDHDRERRARHRRSS